MVNDTHWENWSKTSQGEQVPIGLLMAGEETRVTPLFRFGQCLGLLQRDGVLKTWRLPGFHLLPKDSFKAQSKPSIVYMVHMVLVWKLQRGY